VFVGVDFADFVVHFLPYFSFFWGSLVDREFERIENCLVALERDEQELAEQEQLVEERPHVEQRVVVVGEQAHY